jgi:hypothetical protein
MVQSVGEIHMNKGRVGEERRGKEMDGVVNSVLLPSIALNCLPGFCTKMFNCSGILD